MLTLITTCACTWSALRLPPSPAVIVQSHHALRAAAVVASELKVMSFGPTATPGAENTLEARLAALARIAESGGYALPSAQLGHDVSLVRWATRQRTLHRQGSLAQDVIDRLDQVGFVWDPLQHQWELKLEELEIFYNEHGHCNVPSTHERSALAAWTSRQRQLQRKGELPAARREALLNLSFEFDPMAARWEERLAVYSAALGAGSPVPEPLRRWAARQRDARAAGQLASERVAALHELPGWAWTPPSAQRPSALRRLGTRLAKEIGGAAGARAPPAATTAATTPAPAAAATIASASSVTSCYPRCSSVGRALVVSVGAGRGGAAAELLDARESLRGLGYTVRTVENPSASELHASLVAHALEAGWEQHASSVVAIMAHGFEGSVRGQDEQLASLRRLFARLGPSAAPGLQGKPKIFLVQACRTGERPFFEDEQPWEAARASEAADDAALRGAERAEEAEADVTTEAAEAAEARAPTEVDVAAHVHVRGEGRRLCEEHDFLWGYATTPGTVAYRGALFAAFRRVVEEHGGETSWLELLQHTNERLSAWSAARPAGQPLPSMDIRSTCRGAAFAPSDLVDHELQLTEAVVQPASSSSSSRRAAGCSFQP